MAKGTCGDGGKGGADGQEVSRESKAGEPEPSESLRTFGAFVQALREHAGLSREAFAELVGFSKHTVASIEQGRRMPDIDFIERGDEVLGGTGALKKAAPFLTRRPGLASWFQKWARYELTAISLCTYECRLIPGMLQTQAYTRVLFENRLPPLNDAEIEAQLEARLDRARLLTDLPHTTFSFILDEHLFLRRTGGVEVTRGLIDHVLEMSARRNIEIQILPLACDVHAGLNGPIRLLETPKHQWLGYSEGQESGHLFSDRKTISVLQTRYAKLRSQALTPEDSRALLERLRGAL
ncbi:helix-turn-helix domain-containing protein [Streptomyces sp. NA04227]|uniref:helix-turn-helix domain-containing protein n=1 Tax=Streptomyces sp. NA04227 TaxID=2742136 RepID=UPI001591210C|nr:helix-turn-helix transcriptional regulator [Streptomyces sp. NA04227]QKW07502.1 helix-turn-helix domain-containing protein [Streptomyces sp. NA04227]